ncbi:NEDD4-binding protein 2-like protein [Leptotrombidium deliense]|uniref:NEDD4-binding protein 2-like protein n=1 Tax=Leptotrombidium deliense TaxID=299467 RepID=A0A443SQE6_9ACAR|nr:NEDD4-binding protein 2-like protein [Leptotrombidium deliense]
MDGRQSKRDDHKFVIENKYFVAEGQPSNEDHNAALNLKRLQEMFADCLDADVVEMVFSECAMNVEKSLESLLVLSHESNGRANNGGLSLERTVDNSNEGRVHVQKTDFASVVKNKSNAMNVKTKSTSSSVNVCNPVDEITKCIKQNIKVLVLMRGLPGSGKSTLANQLVRSTNGAVYSTDDFFTSKNSIYQYDWSRIEEAHQWNQVRTLNAILEGITPIFIDNTNLEEWEMRPYLIMGYDNGYKLCLLEPNTVWKFKTGHLARCNKHAISKDKIERMKERFDLNITVEKMIENLKKYRKHEVQNAERSTCNEKVKTEEEEAPSKIDLDLLMVLNQNNTDSESSSRNTSEHGSFVSQETFWEKDDEFMYSDVRNTECRSTSETSENFSQPKAQRQKKSKQTSAWGHTNGEVVEDCSNVSPQTQSKGLLGSISTHNNWEFPPFPVESCNDVEKDNSVSRFVYNNCVSTQTESMDWALLEMKQSGFGKIENMSPEIPDVANYTKDDVIALPLNKNLRVIKIDRGTLTCDVPGDLTFDEKVAKLGKQFNKATESHIREVLSACHEDIDWAFNLLSEFSDEHFTEMTETRPDYLNTSDLNDKGVAQFVLRLEPAFCEQLQKAFGSVTENSITHDEGVVAISHGVAKLLHHLWKKSLKQNSFDNLLNEKLKKGGDVSVQLEQQNAKSSKQVPINLMETPKSSLKEIMDLEMALNLSWNEYYSCENDNSDAYKNLLSTKLKREQLFKTYPGIERQVLDELFEANAFKLRETISVIDQSLGVSAELSAGTEVWVAAEEVSTKTRVKSCTQFNTSIPKSDESEKQQDEELQDIRNRMYQFCKKRKELFEKARESYAGKKYAVASFYSNQARDYQNKIDTASKQVIHNILSATTSNELDLHGLHSSEVLMTVSTYLRLKMEELKRSKLKKIDVDIITGWGAHSTFAPRIKPMVLNYLQSKPKEQYR